MKSSVDYLKPFSYRQYTIVRAGQTDNVILCCAMRIAACESRGKNYSDPNDST